MSLRANGAPSCTANTPTRGISCGALCGLCLPLAGLSCGGDGGASGPHLHLPIDGTSHSGDPGLPELSHGGNGGVLCGAHFGLHWLTDTPSRGGGGGTSSPHLHVPTLGASCGGIPSTPGCIRDGGSGGIPSPRHASLFAQGSNASGCTVVAFTAPPASLMLAVPSVGAGAPYVFASNDASPGLRASATMRSMGSTHAFSAV